MVCSLDTGEPTYIRALPGSVRDVKALCACLKEMKMVGLILVADRGLYSEENIRTIGESGMDYAIPVRRNSNYYDEVSTNEADYFFHKDEVIRYCKKRISDDLYLYRFHNDEMAMSEDRNNLLKVKENKMTFEKYREIKPKQEYMVIVSSLDREPEWIYNLYKRRDSVKKRFRTIFSILEANETYMRDEDKLRGHLFIAFLSLKILSRLEARIRDAGLLDSISVEDVILEYAKAYAVSYQGGKVDYEVPAKVENLDSKLGLDTFPILRS